MESNTKIHKNLVQAVVDTLGEIFIENRYADRAIERTLQSNKKWGARDRAFIAENTYEMVRWWRLITEIGEVKEITPSAIFKLFGVWWLYKGSTIPLWDEFKTIDIDRVKKRYNFLKNDRKVIESIPDWLDDLGTRELNERWEKELHALNTPAEVVLRTNTLKTNRDKLFHLLHEEKVETFKNDLYPDALFLHKRQNVFSTTSFKSGLFEVQDASSQLVGQALGVEPGMRVIDACAGAGGKTLHLAALMKNKGKIIAMDTEEWKLANLKKRAARAGISIIETKVIESSKSIKRLYDSADRLLLDVPCSGLGVLRRNPDAKWKLSTTFIDEIKRTQQKIIQEYSPMLRKSGMMVYSTCSILPSENKEQVQEFIRTQPSQYSLLDDINIYPSESGYDGFYIAKLKRLQ